MELALTIICDQGRVKKIMLADQEVGKIKKETPSLLGTNNVPFLALDDPLFAQLTLSSSS